MLTGSTTASSIAAPYAATPTRDSLENDGVGIAAAALEGAAKTNGQPIGANSRALTGGLMYAYVEDFYERIHIIPPTVNLGNVSTRQISPFRFWSAFKDNRVLNTIELTDFDGIAITDLAINQNFKPYQLVTANLDVSIIGPDEIDAFGEFTMDEGATALLRVFGTRGAGTVFRPNWQAGVTEQIEYKTAISSSLSAREQRRAVRLHPRIRLDYTYLDADTKQGRQASILREFLRREAHLLSSSPVWTDYTRISETLPEGQLTLALDRIPFWMVPGAAFTLLNSETNTMVLASIVSRDDIASTVELQTPFSFVAAKGLKIYRQEAVWFDRGLSSRFVSNTVSNTRLSFMLDPTGLTAVEPPAATVFLAGREVFDTRPNWSQTPSVSYERIGRDLDYGYGAVVRVTDADFTTEIFEESFVGKTYDEIQALKDVFDRARGRAGEFWRPNFAADMIFKDQSDTTIRIQGTAIAKGYELSTSNRGVRLYYSDGSAEDYTVTSIEPQDSQDETILNIGELYRAKPGEVVTEVRWLYVCRFAADTLEVQWLTDEVGQIKMNIQTLSVEPAE